MEHILAVDREFSRRGSGETAQWGSSGRRGNTNKTPCIVSIFLFVLGMVGTASAQSDRPGSVRIVDFGTSGAGCPDGSVDASIIHDGQQLFVGFDKLAVQTVPGGPPVGQKKCHLRVKMEFDPAWSLSLGSVDYRGAAILTAGVKGVQRSSYFFGGMLPRDDAFATTELTGPFDGNYSRRDDMALLLFSHCGPGTHNLMIHAEIRVSGGEGLMTVDSTTQQTQHVYDLRWKRCH